MISSLMRAVEVARGLVGEDDGRGVHQGAGDGHALLLAAGELVGRVAPALRQAHRLQQRVGGRVAAPLPRVDEGQLDVVLRAGARQQVEALEHEPDGPAAHRGELVVGHGGHVRAVQDVGAGGGMVEAAQEVEEGGLARARRPHDRHELPLLEREGHALQRVDLHRAGVVGLGEVLA